MKQDLFEIENRRYLGSKARLLNFIHETINEQCGSFKSFADIFGGTGNVAWSFNDKKTSIIVNDFLSSNYLSYQAFFGDEPVDDNLLKKLIAQFNEYESDDENYFSLNFSDTYFSRKNCIKIGYIREKIDNLYQENKINSREKAILITSLIYAMDHIANTVGHYDAFRANGDLNKKLELKYLKLPKKGINTNNKIFNEDANELVKHIKADIVYIDPPYNSRQYCDAYHLLENVATWKKEEVHGVARKINRAKNIKSDYCTKKAPEAFDDLIMNINAKYIIVSFNNMGTKGAGRSQSKISDDEIIGSLSKKGKVTVFSKNFNQFTTGKTDVKNHQERLFVCECIQKQNNNFIKSPLNYTGGKYKLLPQLFSIFDQREKFIDVFGGGFNVGANVHSDKIIYNDKQEKVCRLIKLIYEEKTEVLLKNINSIIDEFKLSNSSVYGYEYYGCNSSDGLGKYNKEKFEALKKKYNQTNNSVIKDYYLLVLVFFAFNNQIRFNSNDEFNLPVGKRDFNKSLEQKLIDFSQQIKDKNIEFLSCDFDKTLVYVDDKTFVYCDPPYLLGDATYNENNGWSNDDEKRLLKYLDGVNDRKGHFALSNFIEHHGKRNEILEGWAIRRNYKIIEIKSDYSNSNYQVKDTRPSREVLIINY